MVSLDNDEEKIHFLYLGVKSWPSFLQNHFITLTFGHFPVLS